MNNLLSFLKDTWYGIVLTGLITTYIGHKLIHFFYIKKKRKLFNYYIKEGIEIYEKTDNLVSATESFKKSQQIAIEDLNNEFYFLSNANNNIAMMLLQNKAYKESILYFQKSIQNLHDYENYLKIPNNSLSQKIFIYITGSKYLDKPINAKLGQFKSILYINYANCLILNNDSENAKKYLDKASEEIKVAYNKDEESYKNHINDILDGYKLLGLEKTVEELHNKTLEDK